MRFDFEWTKKYEKWVWLAICFFVVFLIYGRTLAGDFVFDDRGIVEHQTLLSDLNQLHRTLASPYWTQEAGLYRPITLASYTFNYVFFGASPRGFHLVNLILYALSGFLIWLLFTKLSANKFFGYLIALLFLVLPIHSEVVANITGRSELLALFFSLLMFWELMKEEVNWWRPGLWFLLAIGSKETAIAALPIAFLIVWIKERSLFQKEIFWKYLYSAAGVLGAGVIYFGVRFLVLGRQYFSSLETSVVENPLKFAPTLGRVATAFKILGLYIQKTFWPFNLCSDYSFNQIPVSRSFFAGPAILGVLIFLFLIASFVFFGQRNKILALGSAIFLFSFLPVANLFFPTGTIAGERLMYYPSLGIVIYLAAIFVWLSVKKTKISKYVVLGLVGGLLIFCGVMSFRRAGDWRTEKSLFTSAAKCAPNSVLSLSNLGAVYYLENDLANAKKWLLSAQAIYPDYPKGVNNLGLVYWKEGDIQKARELFLKALSYRFPYYGAYENLALVSLQEGKTEEARQWLLKFYSGNEDAAGSYINIYLAAKAAGK